MNSVGFALLPVFCVIIIGYGLQVTKLIGDDEWPAINHLCYYVLFPLLIVKTLGTADLTAVPVFRIAGAMLLAITTMSALLLVMRKPLCALLSLENSAYSSLFQGTTRWNAFAALAIIAALYGDDGLTIASIGVATMIPVLNLFNVSILSWYGKNAAATRPYASRMLVRNPFILACTFGIALNLLAVQLPTVAIQTLDLIGRGALGLSLLTVGAALQPTHITGNLAAVFSTAFLRLAGMPFLMAACCFLFGVTNEAFVIVVICGAVPTASAGYVLARQMGGDAELLASIITFQVLAAIGTLPLVILVATKLAG